jgi:hypothetical protein
VARPTQTWQARHGEFVIVILVVVVDIIDIDTDTDPGINLGRGIASHNGIIADPSTVCHRRLR